MSRPEGMTCESVGYLLGDPQPPRMSLQIDHDIVNFARSLLPPTVQLNKQRYYPHITVIREEPELDELLWERDHIRGLQARRVHFYYDPCVVPGEVYWWLRAWSDELIEIRRSLGLPDLAWGCRPPDGEDCFHITIGNTKVLR